MKICKSENCQMKVFSKGFCKYHWQILYGKPIKKISDKHKKTISDYSIKRKKFLEANPICQAALQGCTKKATEIHHKKGKDNRELWIDETYFLAVCRSCHKQIEEGGSWVYEKGFKIKRF